MIRIWGALKKRVKQTADQIRSVVRRLVKAFIDFSKKVEKSLEKMDKGIDKLGDKTGEVIGLQKPKYQNLFVKGFTGELRKFLTVRYYVKLSVKVLVVRSALALVFVAIGATEEGVLTLPKIPPKMLAAITTASKNFQIEKVLGVKEVYATEPGIKHINSICDDRGLPITGSFGYMFSSIHGGLDIQNALGTPIPSTTSGTVTYAGWNNEGYGYLVIVESLSNVQTYYAHLSTVTVVVGQSVSAGDIVGELGSTGNSTGPHLHYEVRKNWQRINPLSTEAQNLTCK